MPEERNYQFLLIDTDLLDVDDQPMPEQSIAEKTRMLDSIKEIGIIEPLVVKPKQDGRYKVEEGRTRREIAQQLDIKRVPCILLDADSDLSNIDISIELEVVRRHLPKDILEKMRHERDQRFSQRETLALQSIEKRLSPRMRQIFKAMSLDGISRNWYVLFLQIARLPKDAQDAFFNKFTGDQNHETENNEIIKNLEQQILEQEESLKILRKKEEEQAKAIKSLRDTFQQRADAEIKLRTKELEDKWKDDNPTSGKLAELIAEAEQKVRTGLEADISEMNAKLQEVTKSKANSQSDVELLKQQLKTMESQKRDYELLAKRNKEEYILVKGALDKVSSAPNVVKQLGFGMNNIQAGYDAATGLGPDAFSSAQKEEIAATLGKIGDLCELLGQFMKAADAKKKKAA